MNRREWADTTVPWLDAKMREKQATNEALAERAGVAPRTIASLRTGKPTRLSYVQYILEAFDKYEYKYSKRGPKPRNRQRITA